MKKCLFLAPILLLLAGTLFVGKLCFAQQKQRTAKALIQTHFDCDHCKKCETCGLKFETELYKIKGIKAFEIDEKAMTILVVYNPAKLSLDSIRSAISHLGYNADDLKADPKAYESLDACCKK